jgi:sodium-dependent phosphate cotransporter
LQVLALLFVFLVGVQGMGTGFKGLGKDLLDTFFEATSNPLVGLLIGLLGTTLVQSSSVSTSMIVAMVAAPDNPLPVHNAVPMIMGANIGTTVTNTIVALAHIGRPDEFRRAYSAATCHDFFNWIAVAVLLPLEMATGVLEKASGTITAMLHLGTGTKFPNPIKAATKAAVEPIHDGLAYLFDDERIAATALVLVSVVIIYVALMFLVRFLRALAATRMQVYLSRSLDASPMIAMIVGVVVTVMVQSSSITTSVLVPLAGAGIITLRQVFPVTLGANVGTTVTAFLASLAVASEGAALGVQIALVHLFFNLIGIGLIYPVPAIRNIPLRAATWLANIAVASKKTAVLYIVVLFYGLPALAIALSKAL